MSFAACASHFHEPFCLHASLPWRTVERLERVEGLSLPSPSSCTATRITRTAGGVERGSEIVNVAGLKGWQVGELVEMMRIDQHRGGWAAPAEMDEEEEAVLDAVFR